VGEPEVQAKEEEQQAQELPQPAGAVTLPAAPKRRRQSQHNPTELADGEGLITTAAPVTNKRARRSGAGAQVHEEHQGVSQGPARTGSMAHGGAVTGTGVSGGRPSGSAPLGQGPSFWQPTTAASMVR
jgi:hypothetical protein